MSIFGEVEHLRTDGGKEAECGTGPCPGEDGGTVTMSDLARLLGVRPIAFAANLGSEAMIEAPKWAQRLFLARVTAALRAASRRLRVVAALRPAARRFRVIAAFWPGVSVTLGLAFIGGLAFIDLPFLSTAVSCAKLIEIGFARIVRPATQRSMLSTGLPQFATIGQPPASSLHLFRERQCLRPMT